MVKGLGLSREQARNPSRVTFGMVLGLMYSWPTFDLAIYLGPCFFFRTKKGGQTKLHSTLMKFYFLIFLSRDIHSIIDSNELKHNPIFIY